MKSIISGIRNYKRGDKIGYGMTYEANDKIKAATLPPLRKNRPPLSKPWICEVKVFSPLIAGLLLHTSNSRTYRVKNLRLRYVIINVKKQEDKTSVENIVIHAIHSLRYSFPHSGADSPDSRVTCNV